MIYLRNLLITIIVLLIITIIFGNLAYFNIINDNVLNSIQLFSFIITIFIESFYLGKIKDKKGYMEGLINGGLISILFLFLNILFKRDFHLYKIIFYFIIIIISMLASILGINKKTRD